MKSVLLSFVLILSLSVSAQSELFKESNPQIIYNMFIESVEPIHLTYDELNTAEYKPVLTGSNLLKMHSDSRHRLETYHKDRLHRDAYTAAVLYLDNMEPISQKLAPVLDDLKTAEEEAIPELMAKLHDITIKEKHHADVYRSDIRKVIELFREDWDHWLEDEVIFFSRLTAQDRHKLYESGFGEKGLKAVKRRFYSSDYFVVNMQTDVTEKRVNTIKASFHDLSEFPDHMVQNVDDFISSVEEPLLRYGYNKEVNGDVYTYNKGSETVFDFVVKSVEVTVHSRASNTVSIKFYY